MTRKAIDQVTTIGIDIGRNTFHLVGPDTAGAIRNSRSRGASRRLIRTRRSWPKAAAHLVGVPR